MLATGREALVFDIEVYSNFFLIVFKSTASGKVWRFQKSPSQDLDRAKLEAVLANYVLVGFNSRNYDIPLIQLALDGYTVEELKQASDDIIVREMSPKEFREHHYVPFHNWNHVDLIEVAPLKASLKIYGGRLHCKKMQDLPIDPSAEVTAEQAKLLFTYCVNDLDVTALLWSELKEQIILREQLGEEYGQDLRSRSDAQIAEHVIAAEVAKLNGQWPERPTGLEGRVYSYKVPAYISYQSPELQKMLEAVRGASFEVSPNGSVMMPPELADVAIPLGFGKYRMGIGGLHSSEKCVRYVSDDDTLLIDRDVASYYPNIILNQKLYPAHMGLAFLHVYDSLVKRRLAAKAAGNKVEAESLKITINGSFGKLGSKWSSLYSPDLLIQVTITGQLCLLMLIEMLELAGVPVISANTDGVLSACPKANYADFLRVVAKWEHLTGFTTEETRYRSYHARDVNNYIGIKENGAVKTKGTYAI